MKFHVAVGTFPKVQNSKLQEDADSETSVHTKHRATPADEKRNSASIAVNIPSNDRCKYGKFSRMTRPNSE